MNEVALVAVSSTPARECFRVVKALWSEGYAVLPVDTRQPDAESKIRELRPSAIVEAGEWSDLDAGIPVPDGTALVVATSGSAWQRQTGRSQMSPRVKAAVISHRAMDESARRVNTVLGTGESTWLCCLPLAHIAGLAIIYRSIVSGVDPVVHDRFGTDTVAESVRADAVSLVPRMLQVLLDSETDLRRFTSVLVGGGSLPPVLMRRAIDAGINVRTSYGMTETCGGCVIDGIALPDVRHRVNQDGVIEIAGPVLAHGYRLRDDLTGQRFRGDWFITDDHGYTDSEGKLHVSGRTDDAIISGGNKIHPREIEEALLAQPLVEDAVVVGIQVPGHEPEITAVVSGDIDSEQLLLAHLENHLPRYKVPRRIQLVQSVPRDSMGKPDMGQIKRMLGSS